MLRRSRSLITYTIVIVAIFLSGYLLFRKSMEIGQQSSINDHLPLTYRVVTDWTVAHATSVPPLAAALKNSFSEVTRAARLRKGEKVLLKINDQQLFTKKFFYTDPDFVDIIERKSLFGNAEKALQSPGNIVLVASFAQEILNTQSTIGQSINIDGSEYRVKAIIEDDENSHLDFDFLLSMESFEVPSYGSLDNWGWITFYTYVKLDSQKSREKIDSVLEKVLATQGNERVAAAFDMRLQSALEIYQEGRFSEDGAVIFQGVFDLAKKHQRQNLVFFIVALLTLFIVHLKGFYFRYAVLLGAIALFGLSLKQYFDASHNYQTEVSVLGFDTENFIIEFDHDQLQAGYASFKEELLRTSVIENLGGSNHIMEGIFGTYRIFEVENGKQSITGQNMKFYPVHDDFFETMSIPFVAGMDFRETELSVDSLRPLILNESAARLLGKNRDPLGKHFFIAGQGGIYGRVVGIVPDFKFDKYDVPVEPLVCFFRDNAFNFVAFKPGKGEELQAYKRIKSAWEKHYPSTELDIRIHNDRDDYILREQKIKLQESQKHVLATGILLLLVLSSLMLHPKKQNS